MSKHMFPAAAWLHPLHIETEAQEHGGWLRDLGLVYENAGDVLLAEGHLAQAVEKYHAALDIFERLATSDPAAARTRSKLAPIV